MSHERSGHKRLRELSESGGSEDSGSEILSDTSYDSDESMHSLKDFIVSSSSESESEVDSEMEEDLSSLDTEYDSSRVGTPSLEEFVDDDMEIVNSGNAISQDKDRSENVGLMEGRFGHSALRRSKRSTKGREPQRYKDDDFEHLMTQDVDMEQLRRCVTTSSSELDTKEDNDDDDDQDFFPEADDEENEEKEDEENEEKEDENKTDLISKLLVEDDETQKKKDSSQP